MIRPQNKTEDSLLLITIYYETPIKQTHRKAEENLEYKLTNPREVFHFQPSISIEESWMTGLASLEFFNSFFNINTTNIKFEIHTDTFDEFLSEELKDVLEEILDLSDITSKHLQDDIIGPRVISAYKKLETEKRQTEGFYILLMCYARSLSRDIERYLRIVIGLDEGDFQLILKQYFSKSVTYEILTGIYTITDISEVVYTMGDHEGTHQIEYDVVSLKTKFVLTRFRGTFGTIRFDENSVYKTIIGFTPFWD